MLRSLIKRNLTIVSILVFSFVFCSVQFLKPSLLYDRDGSLREFGIGYEKKTILPVWLFSLILAILSYVFVLYCLALPKMLF
jgi:hypothetical protein